MSEGLRSAFYQVQRTSAGETSGTRTKGDREEEERQIHRRDRSRHQERQSGVGFSTGSFLGCSEYPRRGGREELSEVVGPDNACN